MSDFDDNVFLFPKARDDTVEPPVERKPKRSYSIDECHHRRKLVLDEAAHQLRCEDCGQVLDPFDWIVDYMGKWARSNTSYRQARQQADQAQKELDALQRKIRSRRAAARRPGVLLTAGDARLLRDQFRALEHVILNLTRDRGDALRRAHLTGYDEKKIQDAYRRLSAAVELHDSADEAASE